jgi:tetratricopeptide (TPR) repeat protein
MKRTVLILLLAFIVCAGTFAQSAEEYFISGNVHYENNNFDKAIADYEAALKIDPNNAEAKNGIEAVRRRRGG